MKVNSEIISLLRLPLMVGVVFIHSLSLERGVYHIYDFCYSLITETLCGVCVPLFFFFSGYLFFQNIETFGFETYKSKIKKRINSLLIPFLFWNLFVVVIIGIGQQWLPFLFTGAFKPISDFSITDWLSIFYCFLGSNKPIAFQLWFLRDLIIMSLMTPLVYYLCQCLKFWWIVILMFLCVLEVPSHIPGISFFSLFYYCAGCWCGINKKSFVFKSHKLRWFSILLFLALLVFELSLKQAGYSWIQHIHRFDIMIGCISILQLASLYIELCDVSKSLLKKVSISNASFFIYCYHGIFAAFMGKLASSLVDNDFEALVCYFLIVVLLVVVGVILYNALLMMLPRFTLVITGGRK